MKPNILLFVSDHHRGDYMPYSKEVFNELNMKPLPIRMPNVKRMMDNGVTFKETITPSPLCAPARACLASVKSYKDCQVRDNGDDYDTSIKTFYSVLRDGGYNVGGVGKFDLHKDTLFWGLDGWVDDLGKMGFTHGIDNEGKWDGYRSGQETPKGPYLKYLHDNGYIDTYIEDMSKRKKDQFYTDATPLAEEAYCDNWIGRNAMEILSKFDKEKPWFLQINFAGPHTPWDITKRMKDEWKDVEFEPSKGMDKVSVEANIRTKQNFLAMIENIDRNIGLIIDFVKENFDLDNTILIYTSDHGDMMGDKDKYGKSVPYRGSVRIPLVISGKNIVKGKITNALCELQDVGKTILDFAKLEMEETSNQFSLMPILKDEDCNTARDYQVSGLNEWYMVYDGRYKAVRRENGENEFYDLDNDPFELENILKGNESKFESLIKKI